MTNNLTQKTMRYEIEKILDDETLLWTKRNGVLNADVVVLNKLEATNKLESLFNACLMRLAKKVESFKVDDNTDPQLLKNAFLNLIDEEMKK